MAECFLCEARKPRRYCPGVGADICSPCCGAEREVTVDCPFDCEYLREARRHEKRPALSLDDFPNRDIRVTEEFLRIHEDLVIFAGRFLLEAAVETPGAADLDVREALEAMISTHRTLESGLVYETRPANPYAAGIQQRLQRRIEQHRQEVAERTGLHSVRNADLLGVLVFLQRLEMQHNNGRRRSRAFLDFLRGYFPVEGPAQSPVVLA